MFAQDFVSYISGWSVSQHTGLDDAADRANFHGNVIVLVLCTVLVSVRQYFMQPMVCYVSSVPGGSNAVGYLTDMCWVEGTVPLNFSAKVSHRVEDWDKLRENRMSYYQWVPFVLGIQTVLYYLPRLLWQIITYNRAGMDLEQLARDASEADNEGNDEARNKIAEHVAKNLEIMLFGHRQISSSKKHTRVWYHIPGKRHGNYLVTLYLLVIKMGYILIGFLQLWLMYVFLRLDQHEGYWFFGIRILQDLIKGRDWSETQVFPRVGMCRHDLEQLGNINRAVAQCLLPINMLNEKIYIFLFFFLSTVLGFTILSLLIWIYRILSRGSQRSLVTHALRVASNCAGEFDSLSTWKIDRFVVEFLRQDGNFVLRMMSMNVGDLTTSRFVQKLYSIYCNDGYVNCDLRNKKKRSDTLSPPATYPNNGNGDNNGAIILQQLPHSNNGDDNFKSIILEKPTYARVTKKLSPVIDENESANFNASAPAYEENSCSKQSFML